MNRFPGSALGDLFSFDLNFSRWFEIRGDNSPAERAEFGFAPIGKSLFLFGGNGSRG